MTIGFESILSSPFHFFLPLECSERCSASPSLPLRSCGDKETLFLAVFSQHYSQQHQL